MLYSLASIPDEKIAELQSIEAEIGRPLLAFAPVKAEPARLDRDKLAKIQDLEAEMGVVLVAVEENDA